MELLLALVLAALEPAAEDLQEGGTYAGEVILLAVKVFPTETAEWEELRRAPRGDRLLHLGARRHEGAAVAPADRVYQVCARAKTGVALIES